MLSTFQHKKTTGNEEVKCEIHKYLSSSLKSLALSCDVSWDASLLSEIPGTLDTRHDGPHWVTFINL